jgi:hypothetical protein
MHLCEVHVPARSPRRFEPLVGVSVVNEVLGAAEALGRRLGGRVVWNINSTAVGGGVAEMLQSLLSYVRGAGINARWLVIRGDEPFFRLTKRLHHALHGAGGDGSPLGEDEHRIYEAALCLTDMGCTKAHAEMHVLLVPEGLRDGEPLAIQLAISPARRSLCVVAKHQISFIRLARVTMMAGTLVPFCVTRASGSIRGRPAGDSQ